MDGTVKPGSDGRAEGGRFAPGNRLAAGNPNNRRMHHLRSRLLAAATDEDVEAVGRKLAELARSGDVQAAKVWLEFVCGKAPAAVEVSGPDGAPLGLNFYQLQTVLLDALADHPAARVAVAARLRGIAAD